MSAVTATRLSSFCRRNEHATCTTAKARCNCNCHPGGEQMPPTPARNLEPVPDETPIPEGVVFEEPPTPGRAAAADRFAAELAAVRTRPGQWARIHTWSSPSSASASAKSLRTKPPAGRWEFRGSKFGDNGSALYVRFIGP